MTVKLADASPISERQLDAFEAELSVELPKSYRQFVLSNNGARPEQNIFRFADNNCGVDQFIPIDEIVKVMNTSWYEFTNRIPIAWAECGNFVLLEIKSGKIFFWDHELPDDTFELAPDIDNFIETLKPFGPDDIDSSEHKLISLWIKPGFMEQLRKEQPELFREDDSEE